MSIHPDVQVNHPLIQEIAMYNFRMKYVPREERAKLLDVDTSSHRLAVLLPLVHLQIREIRGNVGLLSLHFEYQSASVLRSQCQSWRQVPHPLDNFPHVLQVWHVN